MDNNSSLQQEVGFHLARRQAEVEVLYNGQNLQSLHIEFKQEAEELDIDPTYEEQIALEKEMQLVGVKKFIASQEKLLKTGQASQTSSMRRLRRDAIPAAVEEMKARLHRLQSEVQEVDESCEPKTVAAVSRLMRLVDPEVMAMIAVDRIIDGIPVGGKVRTSVDALCAQIGEAVDYEAFMKYLEDFDPRLSRIVAQYYTKNDSLNRDRKIRASIDFLDKQSIDISWDWLDLSERQRVGHFLVQSVIRGTQLFVEERVYLVGDGDDEPLKTPYVINLAEVGEKERSRFERIALEGVSQNWPMIIPPVPWNRDCTQGGYLEVRVGQNTKAIHNNHGGSYPDQMAVDAINNLQQQAWRVNTWILDLEKKLSKQTRKVGKFKPFDEQTYRTQVGMQEIPEEIWKLDKKDPVRRRAIAEHIQARKEMKLRQNIGACAERVLSIAERFKDYPRLYTPWYFDSRLRMYPVVDTLNPQGSDYSKALMEFAGEGIRTSPEAIHELLIAIGTTYGNGVDKQSFEDRKSFAEMLIPRFKELVRDPLNVVQYDFWTKADEPFQFIALIHEYVKVVIDKTQDTHHVSAGLDATCSGIQLAGAILRDQETCRLVNVLPADKPQDAYAAVSSEAVKLLKDNDWIHAAIDDREKAKEKRYRKRLAEQQRAVAEGRLEKATATYERCDTFSIPLELVDRSLAKPIAMLTPYGGQFPTMLSHVKNLLLDKKGHEAENGDDIILTRALVQGMDIALPGYSNVNAWFKGLARTCLKQGQEQVVWVTPNGSLIKQEYREDERKSVHTAVHGQAKVASGKRRRQYKVLGGKTGPVKESKMQTALAANAIHSLDGCVIQMAVHDYDFSPFCAVHDCVYAPSGARFELVKRIRHAFHNVVTSNFLESMIEENELEDFECLPKGEADVSKVLQSDYLFS